MQIGVLGINHKSADLAYRESLARACYKQLGIESIPVERLSCVLLLTCHRSEIYFCAKDLAMAHSALLHVLRREISFPFEHKLYAYFGEDCFLHLAKVTTGLDSLILGESEIQRQVKKAYELASLHHCLPSDVHYLFQKCLQLGKFARSHFVVRGQLTIPKLVYEVSSHLLRDYRVLFLGNSEINRAVIHYFKQKRTVNMALCTRSPISARDFAKEQQLDVVDWSQLNAWQKYDIVVSGTNSSSFLISYPEKNSDTKLIFDLGVPRNIDPRLSWHPRITLLNIDELGKMIEQKQIKYKEVLTRLEEAIEEKVHYYANSFKKRAALCL